MYTRINSELKHIARYANLYDFLLQYHSDEMKKEGDSLRPKAFPSVSVKRNYSGFRDFKTNEHGNSIDFLMKYLGYSFSEAVEALAGRPAALSVPKFPTESEAPTNSSFVLPISAEPPFKRAFAYLTISRRLPSETVNRLIDVGLIYQDALHGNVVFVNHERNYCEIRGTISYGLAFHQSRKQSPDNYWSFGRLYGEKPRAFICEAAIDAISLYELRRKLGDYHAVYCSIGGVANQKAIERIANRYSVILAVDNDEAGDLCRKRNPSLPFILPVAKDWNQDWQNSLCAKQNSMS